jgi:hypothetical protein
MTYKSFIGLFICTSFFGLNSQARTFIVNGPGSSFTSIQEAIDSCIIYNTDTVLVYPGTYYENLVINKDLVLASLFMVTGNQEDIENTIIDGSGLGSCIQLSSGWFDTWIIGLTIIHGNAEFGGGINAEASFIFISDCIIRNNHANYGGGLCSSSGGYLLSSLRVLNNSAEISGGGAYLYSATFNPDYLCSIYDNHAPRYCDLSISGSPAIYLDTFTVINPDLYFFGNYDSVPIYINYGMHEQVSADLYISPDGDNDNTGTSPEEPLKNLWMALVKVKSCDTIVRTIHLAPGIYSPTETDEKFPLGFKNNIELRGSSAEETILNADSLSKLFEFYSLDTVRFTNLAISNGIGSRHYGEYTQAPGLMKIFSIVSLEFKGVSLDHGHSSLAAVYIDDVLNLQMNETSIHDNYGAPALSISYNKWSDKLTRRESRFRNCSFYNNLSSTGGFFGSGGSIIISESDYDTVDDDRTEFINCEFHHNRTYTYPTAEASFPALLMSGSGDLIMANCNISDNIAELQGDSAQICLNNKIKARVYNSIFYNNLGQDIWLYTKDTSDAADFEVYNSLFEFGSEKIIAKDPLTQIYYDLTNITGDPLFSGNTDHPYSLLPGSPCIDAGTINLPDGLALPSFDLAGNPRIYNDSVDIGAYEFHVWENYDENQAVTAQIKLKAFCHPNPFSAETRIKITGSYKGKINMTVYSSEGRRIFQQQISKLEDEPFEIKWDGNDISGNPVLPGIYLLKLNSERGSTTIKLIKASNN